MAARRPILLAESDPYTGASADIVEAVHGICNSLFDLRVSVFERSSRFS